MTGYLLRDRGSVPGWGTEFYLYHHCDHACYMTRPSSYTMCTGYFSHFVKCLGHETDFSPSSNAEVKNEWRNTSAPYIFSTLGSFSSWSCGCWNFRATGRSRMELDGALRFAVLCQRCANDANANLNRLLWFEGLCGKVLVQRKICNICRGRIFIV